MGDNRGMSFSPPARPLGRVPRGEVIGQYPDHAQAQATVGYLAEQEFEVSTLAIVGSDVRVVERVVGVVTWAKAAGRGALTGAWLGMLFGLVMALFGGNEALTSGILLPGILIGVGLGMMWGLLRKALTRRQRSVMAQPQVVAQKYELLCPPEKVGAAREVLARRPSA